jgi:hypothetical protein
MIASDADRVHVPDQIPGLVQAIEADLTVVFEQLPELLLGLGEQRGLGSDQRQNAANLRAVRDATRIHPYEVKSLNQGWCEHGFGLGDVFHYAVARPSRIEEERAYALLRVLGWPSRDRQENRCSRGLRPIKRHPQGARIGFAAISRSRPGDLETRLTRISRGLSATDDQEQRGKQCNMQAASAEY